MSFLLHGPFQTIDADAVFPQKCAKKKGKYGIYRPRSASAVSSSPSPLSLPQHKTQSLSPVVLPLGAMRLGLNWPERKLSCGKREEEVKCDLCLGEKVRLASLKRVDFFLFLYSIIFVGKGGKASERKKLRKREKWKRYSLHCPPFPS